MASTSRPISLSAAVTRTDSRHAEREGFYQVHEQFWTVQGEGTHTGRTAYFIRLQGCPVGCPWCDAKLTWFAGGRRMYVTEIVAAMDAMPWSELVVITGGEPLIHNLDALIEALRAYDSQREVHLETSGVYPWKGRERPDWVTLSPKFGYTTGREPWHVDDSVLISASELKYVVDEDLDDRIISGHTSRLMNLGGRWDLPVVLMPEGCPPRGEMVEKAIAMMQRHPHFRFGTRLQYTHPQIAKLEGDTNQQISVAEARQRARELVHSRRTGGDADVE